MSDFTVRDYKRPGYAGYPTTWAEACRLVEGGRTRVGYRNHGKKIGNNTVLYVDGDLAAVRLHQTDVVTFYADGRIELNSGGWQTATTRDRIRACGVSIGTMDGVASVTWHGRDYVFRDGMTLYPDGRVKGDGGDPIEVRKARRRNLRRNPDAPRCETRMSSRWPGGNVPEAFGRNQ